MRTYSYLIKKKNRLYMLLVHGEKNDHEKFEKEIENHEHDGNNFIPGDLYSRSVFQYLYDGMNDECSSLMVKHYKKLNFDMEVLLLS